MKTFTTSIFVPAKAKKEMLLRDTLELAHRLNTRHYLMSDELGLGGLDDIQEDEEFVIIVNGAEYKHEIKMKGANRVAGKIRLMVVEPQLPEVRRFLEWRLELSKIFSLDRGSRLQLKNFTTADLRKLIRHAFSNQERQLVTYR